MTFLRRFGLDGLLVLLAIAVVASVLASNHDHRGTVAVLSASALLAFCGRRLSPLAATVAAWGLIAIGMTLDPSATTAQFVAMLFTFALAGAVNCGRELLVAAGCGIALLAYATLGLSTGAGPSDFALSSVISLGFLAAGWQVSRHGHLLTEARDSAEVAAAEHQERTRRALVEERARIARELHDVVSHGLSVVVVQAQAARGAIEDLPDDRQIGRRLEAVEDTAREALGEMRRMLGLLQLDDLTVAEDGSGGTLAPRDDDPEPPSPGLADLSGLVERARLAGCEVAADLPDPALDDAGAGVQLAVYRIVQESLTNVLKHAPGASVSVCVVVESGEVDIRVRNTLAPALAPTDTTSTETGGHGLVGMRERATTYGGRCTAGPVDEMFEVHAVLPVERQRQESPT